MVTYQHSLACCFYVAVSWRWYLSDDWQTFGCEFILQPLLLLCPCSPTPTPAREGVYSVCHLDQEVPSNDGVLDQRRAYDFEEIYSLCDGGVCGNALCELCGSIQWFLCEACGRWYISTSRFIVLLVVYDALTWEVCFVDDGTKSSKWGHMIVIRISWCSNSKFCDVVKWARICWLSHEAIDHDS